MRETHELKAGAADETMELANLPPPESQVSDGDLLREYIASRSETAFAQLVARYAGLVYSAALRQAGDHATAQEVTQVVFIILARKAGSLPRATVLAGWLFRAARFAVLDARKLQLRRQIREEEAARMQLVESAPDSPGDWERLAPLLDDALAGLAAKDRDAVLLRFFEKKGFGEIGAALGGNENSARLRVLRAVEKLRAHFHQRGVTLTVVTISGLLLSQATSAAPAGVATAVTNLAWAHDGAGALEPLVRSVTRRLFAAPAQWIWPGVLILLLVLGGTIWQGNFRAERARRAEEADLVAQAAIAGQARTVVAAIDRALWLNQPDRVGQLVFFRPAEAGLLQPAFRDYLRATAAFREALEARFPGRETQVRSFTLALNELLAGQPPPRGAQTVLTASRATDDSFRSHAVVLTNVTDGWKWDWLVSLSPEARQERLTALQRKTALMDSLTRQISDGTVANADEVFARFETP